MANPHSFLIIRGHERLCPRCATLTEIPANEALCARCWLELLRAKEGTPIHLDNPAPSFCESDPL